MDFNSTEKVFNFLFSFWFVVAEEHTPHFREKIAVKFLDFFVEEMLIDNVFPILHDAKKLEILWKRFFLV